MITNLWVLNFTGDNSRNIRNNCPVNFLSKIRIILFVSQMSMINVASLKVNPRENSSTKEVALFSRKFNAKKISRENMKFR